MIKDFFKNIKKYFEKWFKTIKSNKIYSLIFIFTSTFIVFAVLSRFWQSLAYVAYISFCLIFVMIGFLFQRKHKNSKYRFRVAMHKQMLSEKEVKIVKRELFRLKITFVSMYLISISIIWFFLQTTNIL